MVGDAALIRLRDLPGVVGITDLCRNPRNFEYPISSYTQQKIDDVSIRLFGITRRETMWDYEPYPAELGNVEYDDDECDPVEDDSDEGDVIDCAAEEATWEQPFHVTRLQWPESRAFWLAIGWDISDGNGAELLCAHCFDRQIIATVGKLIEGTRLTLDGSGTWKGEEEAREALLTDRLKREADEFIAKRRR